MATARTCSPAISNTDVQADRSSGQPCNVVQFDGDVDEGGARSLGQPGAAT